ncbi:MAG: bifunctional folylpolyglutamate synthase/dihydrofolate synthase [Desulfarculus sp.]|nr:bifunctional folylpolyglutamate synthase/dihydrofolate synthase [Pseudomonadota bacterium]MBV1715436.1 bifunctional folylpolyglutamate synthase/dihydrofolate synthase [Desulfarculus sp.]MBU4575500.1 bifunctional folylpolyglutamate synthase/dihydrofolate synthase [Pseudomonadota bacterium]MBU4596217.1 bifunctional folylpolyglutamate synthase/dihydrofolate synthase [Pseudomonadota bacterium]MBV1737631.1 bifunctional folylpolyglutamate synthase/dihydrofolate synthase [Desulfarculus sp.]
MSSRGSAYQKAVAKLYELQKFGIKLGLSSTRNLLKGLGDPHKGLACVHLAGTNGKGSVGAMLEAALMRAGVKVGFYTSPHLERFTERFRIDGKEISQGQVVKLCKQVWQVVDHREPPTYFEFVTAMAFALFRDQGVELAIMETGLGGRLDATNICEPLVTVITNLSREHEDYLGKGLANIAFEKAGIIKPKVPLVHGVTQPVARKVVEDTALAKGAPIHRRGRELNFRRNADESFNLRGRMWSLPRQTTNLVGRHQPINACLALGAAEVLAEKGLPVTAGHLAQGLNEVHWPGRLEQWPTEPGQATLWLDGAHNPGAAQALLTSLEGMRRGRKPLVMVVGVMADKEVGKLLGLILPAADMVVYSRPVYARAAAPEVLAAAAPPDAPPGEIEPDLGKAMGRARILAGPQGVVLVTGSLFTVGEARTILSGGTSDLP